MLRDFKRAYPEEDDLIDDAALLVSQAERCRDILGRLSRHVDAGDLMHDRLGVDALLREAAGPFLDQPGGPLIRIETKSLDGAPAPVLKRRPEIIFGLRNFIENAAGYARGHVLIRAEWTAERLAVSVHDDGPGFSSEVLTRLGEPYVSARGGKTGLGLGFFIAKTLLESSGAAIRFDNRPIAGHDRNSNGAWVQAEWALNGRSSGLIA
jgi:two-component system sensor histidine kinase RegB